VNCDLCGEPDSSVGPVSALSSENHALWTSTKHSIHFGKNEAQNICRTCWLQFVLVKAKRWLTKADDCLTEYPPSWSSKKTPEERANAEVEECIALLADVFGYTYTRTAPPPTFKAVYAATPE
jgi:hypothetical protein